MIWTFCKNKKFIFFCNLGPEEVGCELPDQLPATKVGPNRAGKDDVKFADSHL